MLYILQKHWTNNPYTPQTHIRILRNLPISKLLRLLIVPKSLFLTLWCIDNKCSLTLQITELAQLPLCIQAYYTVALKRATHLARRPPHENHAAEQPIVHVFLYTRVMFGRKSEAHIARFTRLPHEMHTIPRVVPISTAFIAIRW